MTATCYGISCALPSCYVAEAGDRGPAAAAVAEGEDSAVQRPPITRLLGISMRTAERQPVHVEVAGGAMRLPSLNHACWRSQMHVAEVRGAGEGVGRHQREWVRSRPQRLRSESGLQGARVARASC